MIRFCECIKDRRRKGKEGGGKGERSEGFRSSLRVYRDIDGDDSRDLAR